MEPVTPPPHLPPFTVADVIVTPDPFRDVIRTEPAPDLSSLIGEIVPYFWDQSTRQTLSSTTPISITTLEPAENTTEFVSATSVQPLSLLIISSTTPSTTASTTTSTTSSTTHPPTIIRQETTQAVSTTLSKIESSKATTSSNVTTVPTTTSVSLFDLFGLSENETKAETPNKDANKEVKEEEPVEDELSFDSVFSYLFDSDRWTTTTTTTTENPPPKTTKPFLKKANSTSHLKENETLASKFNENKSTTQQTLEHRSDENIDDLTNHLNISSIETTKNPFITTTSVYLPSTTETTTTTEKTTTSVKPTTTVTPITKNPIYLSTTIKSSNVKVSTKRYGTKYPTTPKYSRPPVTPMPSMSVPDPGAASGLLKLAGCNIYGRMYRVGRIISELSGPCLECMCTEVGVQCRPLKC